MYGDLGDGLLLFYPHHSNLLFCFLVSPHFSIAWSTSKQDPKGLLVRLSQSFCAPKGTIRIEQNISWTYQFPLVIHWITQIILNPISQFLQKHPKSHFTVGLFNHCSANAVKTCLKITISINFPWLFRGFTWLFPNFLWLFSQKSHLSRGGLPRHGHSGGQGRLRSEGAGVLELLGGWENEFFQIVVHQ